MTKLGIPGLSINGLAYADVRLSVIPVIEAARRPTGKDKKYPLFCFWRTNKFFSGVEGEIWVLIRFDTNGDAVWVQFEGAAATAFDGLKDQDDNISTPDVDNTIKLTGGANIQVNQTNTSEMTISLLNDIPPQQQTEVDVLAGIATNPVVPDSMGLVVIEGNHVAAHSSPVETVTRNDHEWSIDVQLATTSASPADPNDVGLCSFDPTNFLVTDGWVEFIGGGGTGDVDTITVDAVTAPGVNPVEPDGTGSISAFGADVTNNEIPVRTHTIALNEYRVEVQQATTVTPTPADRRFIGLSCYNENQFTIDTTSGMVSLAGGDISEGLLQSLTGNSGGAVFSDASANIDFVGDTTQGFVDIIGTPGSNSLETKLTGLNDAELYIGNTTLGDPQTGTITSTDGSVTITYDDPNINLSATGGTGISCSEVSTDVNPMVANTKYIVDSASDVTLTLPSTSSVCDNFIVIRKGSGNVTIAQNASQQIHVSGVSTTSGASGYLDLNTQYDSIWLTTITTDLEFTALPAGTYTLN